MATRVPIVVGGSTGIEEMPGSDTVPVSNLPVMTSTVGGAVPTPPNNTTKFLRGDGTFDWALMPLEPAVNQTGEGVFMSAINAGATIAAFECVYLGSAGTWLLTDADAASTSAGLLAIAMESKTSAQLIRVALPGTIIRNDSWNWATVGAPIYLSVTSGALTQTITTGTNKVVRVVGYALTDDCIFFYPSPNYITLN